MENPIGIDNSMTINEQMNLCHYLLHEFKLMEFSLTLLLIEFS